MSATPSFAPWRSALSRLGFRGLGTGGRKGTYLGREVGPVEQAIGVLVSDARDGAFNVQLNVNMPLRCAEPAHRVVLLDGDVAADGVRIRVPWIHEPGLTTWWPPDQTQPALDAVLTHGVSWLDRFAVVPTLIEYFEREYTRFEDEDRRTKSPAWHVSLRRRLGVLPPARRSAHIEYLLWLSMLYETAGRLDLARERLHAYAQAVASRHIATERERLARHRRALGMTEA